MAKFIPLIFLLACGVDREINSLSNNDIQILDEFAQMNAENHLRLAPPDEPGEPLLLCLRFVNKETQQALPSKRIHFYHADASGEYNPTIPGDESTARLNGEAITDKKGRIFLMTTLPGDYGSSDDNRHIHTTVFGARPEAYDIHFKQYCGFMLTRFVKDSDHHFLADLKLDSRNNLVAFLTIEVKNL